MPTAEAQLAETMADIHRAVTDAGQLPVRKFAASASILRQILGPIPRSFPACATARCCRLDRAPKACERGPRLALPHCKGEHN
jgi:hypothetical protein